MPTLPKTIETLRLDFEAHAPLVTAPWGTWEWMEQVETRDQVEALAEVARIRNNPPSVPLVKRRKR